VWNLFVFVFGVLKVFWDLVFVSCVTFFGAFEKEREKKRARARARAYESFKGTFRGLDNALCMCVVV